MKNVPHNKSRAMRLARPAVTAVAAAAVVAGAAGIVAGQGNAAPLRALQASHPAKAAIFKHPTLKHRLLTIEGTKASDKVAIRLQSGKPGILQVDVGDDGSANFTFKRTQIARIAVNARAGNDRVRIVERNGVFTNKIRTRIDGGDGNDTLLGGSRSETLLGGGGNDSLDGNGGNDVALLGAGDDTFAWDPGDGSDTIEGQAGADTLRFNGANASERVNLSANGNRLRFLRDANITMDTAGVERVDFNALGGADVVSVDDLTGTDVTSVNVDLTGTLGGATGDGQLDQVIVNAGNRDKTIRVGGDASAVAVSGLSAQVAIQHQDPSDELHVNGLGGNDDISAAALAAQAIALTLDGGAGNDTLAGGIGAETSLGGEGNDSLDGNGGNDVALLGVGDDTFVWDPGDGSDTIEGQAGTDTMLFNGANVAERVDLSANANRLRFFRDVGNITMDTAGVERVDFNALGGADLVTVNDLAGTDVGNVNVDLAGSLGGTTGDGSVDRVVVNGTSGDDTINVGGDAAVVPVSGLRAQVAIRHQEASDGLVVNGLAGNDAISAAALAAQAISLTLDGGAGNDTLAGGKGIETLLGSDGNDTLDGNGGNDLALMGAGDDTFVWDPGDGSDTVEGQDGTDTMRFNGAGVAEQVELSANGNRLRLFRDVATITMDTAGVERVDFNALGGADLVTVDDLTGTDVTSVNVDLAGALGGAAGDGSVDRVVVNGTSGDDTIDVSGDASGVAVSGLRPLVAIRHQEPSDELRVNGLGGDATRSTGTRATTWRCWAPATTPSSGIPATAATPSKARTATTRCASTAPTPTSASVCRRIETGSRFSATPTSRWTPQASRWSTSMRSAAPTSSASTT